MAAIGIPPTAHFVDGKITVDSAPNPTVLGIFSMGYRDGRIATEYQVKTRRRSG